MHNCARHCNGMEADMRGIAGQSVAHQRGMRTTRKAPVSICKWTALLPNFWSWGLVGPLATAGPRAWQHVRAGCDMMGMI